MSPNILNDLDQRYEKISHMLLFLKLISLSDPRSDSHFTSLM